MRLDREFLAAHASYAADGIEERAFFMEVDGDRCHAVLYAPARPADPGFVVCHSYGLEVVLLRRVERALGRALAGLGHPVLAFHGRGYGDSTGRLEDATVERHLEDVAAASARLSRETGAGRLGLVGCRLGGLTAILAAARLEAERLILVNPVLRGRDYPAEVVRDMHIVRLAAPQGAAAPAPGEVLDALEREGVVDVLGYPLYRPLFRELASVDVTGDAGGFGGEALVFRVSKRPRLSEPVASFRTQVEARGGRCEIALAQEPPGVRLGARTLVSTRVPHVRADGLAPLLDEMTGRVAAWMAG